MKCPPPLGAALDSAASRLTGCAPSALTASLSAAHVILSAKGAPPRPPGWQ
jgi:hypothetical protein